MKISFFMQDDRVYLVCNGKLKGSQDFLVFKKTFAQATKEFAPLKEITISLDTAPLDLNLIGFLLAHTHFLKIGILVSNYSCFRMLEDLFLLEKFDVKYQKEK